MKVLASSQPGIGHFTPLEPVLEALTKAGHDLVVAGTAPFVPFLESRGWKTLPAGLPYRLHSLSTDLSDVPPPGERETFMRALFGEQTARATLADLTSGVQAVDLVVRDYLDFGSALFAARRGIPCVAIGAYWNGVDRALAPIVRATAEQEGVSLGELHAFGPLAALPESWRSERDPAGMRFFRPRTPTALGEDSGQGARHLLHITLGTTEINRYGGALLTKLWEAGAVAAPDTPIIATTGERMDDLGPVPPQVELHRRVDHRRLLPRCRVVVCSGGQGTLMACASAGVPVVVVPMHGDQPSNAARAAALGFGAVADPRDDVATLSAAIRRVWNDPAYTESAQRLQREIALLPTPQDHLPWLEQIAAGR